MSNISYDGFGSLLRCHDISPAERRGTMSLREASVLLAFSRFFKPRRYLELGVATGDTAAFMLRNSTWIGEYIGIDAKASGILTTYDEKSTYPLPNPGYMCTDSRFKIFLREDGVTDPALVNGFFDMVFIDSDHTYEGVVQDTAVAEKVLSGGRGVLLWHDYGKPGVTKFLNERNAKSVWPNPACLVEGTSICFEIRGYG